MPTPSEIIAAHIRAKTLNALQDADEIGGPDRADYIHLMESIAKECLRRAETAREQDPQIQVLRWAQKNIASRAFIQHTGGGCTAIEIPASGAGPDAYWLITDDCSAPETMDAPQYGEPFYLSLYGGEGEKFVGFTVTGMEDARRLIESFTGAEW
jgi:hypothetical protein